MLKINKVTKVEVTATFRDKPIIGPVELLSDVVAFLEVDWEGRVTNYLPVPLDSLDKSWFDPSDKGGLGVFGLDKFGKVILGMAYYSKGINEIMNPCYVVVKTDKCDIYA